MIKKTKELFVVEDEPFDNKFQVETVHNIADCDLEQFIKKVGWENVCCILRQSCGSTVILKYMRCRKMKLTQADVKNVFDKLRLCNKRPILRSAVYGLKDEKEPLEYWIEHFKNDNSVMLYDAKTGKMYYKGEIFNKECKVIV